MTRPTKSQATAHAVLGDLLERKQDLAGAHAEFKKSLELESEGWRANQLVTKLLAAINGRAEESWDVEAKAHKLLDEYRALAALVPTNRAVRNDGGFFCREAFQKSGKRDAVLLKGSVELYVAASELIPAYQESFEETVPYAERHTYAQILNDTGLMFQYEPTNLNLGVAEGYYRRAMEWTQHGYWDTYGNLIKLLTAQGRWKDAFEFAAACAEGIKKADGTPNETFRATCAAQRDLLEKKVPADGK